jgi:hypothetical protein
MKALGKIKFLNALGSVIYSMKINPADQKIYDVDISEFAPGVYFILLETEGKMFRQHFIKH